MNYIDNTAKTARYSSGQDDYVLNDDVFSAIPVSRGEISFEFEKTDLTLIMPHDYWPASDFKLVNPYGVINLSVLNAVGDTVFSGRVRGVTFEVDKGTAKVIVTSIQEVLDSQVPVKVYSPSCPYELYGGKCGVNQLNYVINATISGSSITGKNISNVLFSGYDDGYFTGGWIETEKERVTIIAHTGSTITLLYDFVSVATEDTLDVFPGCDKLLDTCDTVYSNISKFGGFPWVPENNPVREEF